jgi:hypothetical protein
VVAQDVEADAALHTDKEIFDRLVRGEASPLTSMLRGLVQAGGDTELIVLFQGAVSRTAQPALSSGSSRRGETTGMSESLVN